MHLVSFNRGLLGRFLQPLYDRIVPGMARFLAKPCDAPQLSFEPVVEFLR